MDEAAVFGIVGVFVGAVITAGTNYLLAVRKERADAAAARRSHAREVRRAARLIDFDFHSAQITAKNFVEGEEWTAKGLTANAWKGHKHVIASELSEADWNTVAGGGEAITLLVDILARAERDRAKSIVDPNVKEMGARMLDLLKDGRAALAPLKQDDPAYRKRLGGGTENPDESRH